MKTKIKSFTYSHWSLVIVFLLAAIMRLWNLANIPPSLTPDEAALGYNAYSILKTGRDEHGELFPLIFSSFGDYKPGLYVYATVPFVAVFGLNEWSVRLPSALAGIVSVYFIYLIVLSLTKKKLLSTLVALFAALSSWLIHLSRGAWETNFAFMLTLAGVYFIILSLKRIKYLPYSAILLALTFLTYQGAKLSTTIILLILVVCFWGDVKGWFINQKSKLIASTIIGFIIITPILLSFFQGRTGRLEVNSVFSYPRPAEYLQNFLQKANENVGDTKYYLFHSESLNFTRGILGRWFNHYSGRFLFFEGDYQNPRHSAPNHGMLALIEILLIPLGIIYLIRTDKIDQRFKKLILLWLVLSPIPSALSRDQVHAVRSINLAFPFVILSGMGLYYLIKLVNGLKFVWRLLYFSVFAFIFFTSLIYFLDSYFVHLHVHNAKYWHYGHKEVAQKVIALQQNYDRVLFQQSYSQPYIYILFYGSHSITEKYDPSKLQLSDGFANGEVDVSLVKSLDNIRFEFFSWPPPFNPSERTLIIGDSVAIPGDFSRADYNLIEEIIYPDGYTTAFRILENK